MRNRKVRKRRSGEIRAAETRDDQRRRHFDEARAVAKERNCKHLKFTKYGVCERCGFRNPTYQSTDGGPFERAPTVQEHTEVFELDTLEGVLKLFKRLVALKRIAPRSLRYTIAVTARRITTFQGSDESYGRVPDITRRIEK